MSEDDEDFLSVRQVELYGRFGAAPSGEELERFFFLDDEDRSWSRGGVTTAPGSAWHCS